MRALPCHRSRWRESAQRSASDARCLPSVQSARIAGGAFRRQGFEAQGNAADRLFRRGCVRDTYLPLCSWTAKIKLEDLVIHLTAGWPISRSQDIFAQSTPDQITRV